MAAASTMKIIESSLSIIDKLLDQLPNIAQRKKKELLEYRNRIAAEVNSGFQDMDLALDLLEEIALFLKTWDKELNT